MAFNLCNAGMGCSLDRQRFNWKDLVQKPISKLDDDVFHSRHRNVWNRAGLAACEADGDTLACSSPRAPGAAHARRAPLGTMINWLISSDHSPLETTIGYEQAAIELTASVAESEPPCADISGVMGMGFLQVVTDPRTTVSQALNAMLAVELADNASWELLIQLAQRAGHDDMARDFTSAHEAERRHLELVTQWTTNNILEEAA